MGGTDDPSNIVELTPEEHADAHKILFEKHGRWQDYVAWQGLAGLAKKSELIQLILSEAGKKGSAISNMKRKGMKYDTSRIKYEGLRKGVRNPAARTFEVSHINGTVEIVKSLKTWCEEKGLNYNTFYNQCIGRGKTHKDYSAKIIP